MMSVFAEEIAPSRMSHLTDRLGILTKNTCMFNNMQNICGWVFTHAVKINRKAKERVTEEGHMRNKQRCIEGSF